MTQTPNRFQTLIAPPKQRKRRPHWAIELGIKLLPEAVTEAWYAANCPPNGWKPNVSLRLRLQFRLSAWLRGLYVS